DEILARPASDFVARFVGADRGLKRLALSRVGDLSLQSVVTARIGSDAADARRRCMADPFPYLLVVDEHDRPLEWITASALAESGPIQAIGGMPATPVFDRRTTLKDALSMLLASDVQAGIVVDGAGAVRGLVTADMIGERMRP
ncbi:MAG: ABC transporter ATP-binding protein, partial [Chloroflexota bacterium]